MAKHFELTITDDVAELPAQDTTPSPPKRRWTASTSSAPACAETQLDADATVAAYKSLADVERAFRSMKTVDLKVRPIFHYTEQRVRAHVFLCMLAYYVEWHMRERSKPMLFDDEYLERGQRGQGLARGQGGAIRARQGQGREQARPTTAHRCTASEPCCRTSPRWPTTSPTPASTPKPRSSLTTRPTPLQTKAFKLLGLNPACTQ